MKKTVLILTAAVVLTGCEYDELPPKTDDITTSYVLPKGEEPSAEEKQIAAEAVAEYQEAMKK